MINILDLVFAALALFYLLKHAGGIMRTIKNFLVVIIFLLIFGVVVRLMADVSFLPTSVRQTVTNSYFVKLSSAIIKWGYPSVEKTVPNIDNYIKKKIITEDTSGITMPKLSIEAFPKVVIPTAK